VALEMRNVPAKVCCSSLKISLEELYNGNLKEIITMYCDLNVRIKDQSLCVFNKMQ
jgi:hypothetical protein